MVRISTLIISWDAFASYLLIEKKQKGGKNLNTIKSRFKKLEVWLGDKELTRDIFNQFIYYLKEEKKYQNTYINCFIKLIKHVDTYSKLTQFKDYTYFPESREKTEVPLTPREIKKLAEVNIPYYRDRALLNQKYKALIYFLGVVGSRITETFLLKRENLVSGAYPMVHFPAEITKTFKSRDCPIPRWLYQMLLELPEAETLFGFKDEPGCNRDLKKRALECGIKKNVHAHLFRDSSINNQLEDNIPLEEVTQYHGHSSTETTYKYYIRVKLKRMAENLSDNYTFFTQEQTTEMLEERCRKAVEKLLSGRKINFVINIKNGIVE